MDKTAISAAVMTTGGAVIGATGLNDTLTQVFTDIFTWAHVANYHAGAWAGLTIIGVGSWMHTKRPRVNQAVQNAAPNQGDDHA